MVTPEEQLQAAGFVHVRPIPGFRQLGPRGGPWLATFDGEDVLVLHPSDKQWRVFWRISGGTTSGRTPKASVSGGADFDANEMRLYEFAVRDLWQADPLLFRWFTGLAWEKRLLWGNAEAERDRREEGAMRAISAAARRMNRRSPSRNKTRI